MPNPLFTDPSFGLRALANPGLVQHAALAEAEARLGGEYQVADVNNGFVFLMEYGSSALAALVRETETELNAVYKRRATRAEELHKHMSDFDYLQLVSKPASTTLQLTMDRTYLQENAVALDGDYKLVIIPASTVFTLGGREFMLYYPIRLRINVNTGVLTATYDGNVANPLAPLVSNQVPLATWSFNGLELVGLTFPVYQFSRRVDVTTLAINESFTKTYRYDNRFYAARVYTRASSAEAWRELAYTLSDDVYDRAVATAKLTLLEDRREVRVTIPQIYRSKGLVANQIKVELYTTQGALDVPITQAEIAECNYAIDPAQDDVTQHSSILTSLPRVNLAPAEGASRITGGSNGISFAELRERVINGSTTGVPITDFDLTNAVKDQGFALVKSLDNITDRIYYASRTMLGGTVGVVPVAVASVQLTPASLATAPTVRVFPDDVITLLPTTVYRYTPSTNVCAPLNADELTRLQTLSKAQLASELNAVTYTRTPLHVVVYTADRYPLAKTFNLMTPRVDGIELIRENPASPAQMSVVLGTVIHDDNGTGGYRIRLGVAKTPALQTVPEDQLYVVLQARDRADHLVHVRASYVGAYNGMEIYDARIVTDYHLTQDGYFRTALTTADGTVIDCELPLDCVFDVRMLAARSALPGVPIDANLMGGVPDAYASTTLGLLRQTLHVSFGRDLSDAIFNTTDATWTSEQYATWPTDVPYTYPKDEYVEVEGPGGTMLPKVVIGADGTPHLEIKHRAGDVVRDADGNPVIRYPAGSFKRTPDGQLIQTAGRELIYFVDAMMFDYRLYVSEAPEDVRYVDNLPAEISGYVTTVSTVSQTLIEQTKLYFRPTRTMGTTVFGLGGGTSIRLDVGLRFGVRYLVPKAVASNEAMLDLVRKTTRSVIQAAVVKNVISVTSIGKELENAFKDVITSVEVDGINATPGLRTLIAQDSAVAPMVAQRLVLGADDKLSLELAIDIDFVSTE